MNLLYDGVLDASTAEYVASLARSYPYIVEVSPVDESFWAHFREWADKTLDVHSVPTESGSSGETYIKRTHLWGTVSKNNEADTRFICFNTQREKDAFVAEFQNVNINSNPFRSVISV